MKRKLIIIAAILFIAGMMLFAYTKLTPGAEAGEKNVTVEVVHLNREARSFSCRTDAQYLRGLLEEYSLAGGSESTYGLWIETVDGETADPGNEEWWGFTVNGETALYGADEQVINDGDKIVFTLNVGYETYN